MTNGAEDDVDYRRDQVSVRPSGWLDRRLKDTPRTGAPRLGDVPDKRLTEENKKTRTNDLRSWLTSDAGRKEREAAETLAATLPPGLSSVALRGSDLTNHFLAKGDRHHLSSHT